MIETAALDFLVPSWWEIKVTVAAAMFVILSFCFFSWSGGGGGDGGGGDRAVVLENSGDGIDEKDKVSFWFPFVLIYFFLDFLEFIFIKFDSFFYLMIFFASPEINFSDFSLLF